MNDSTSQGSKINPVFLSVLMIGARFTQKWCQFWVQTRDFWGNRNTVKSNSFYLVDPTSTQYHSKMWHRSTVKCEMDRRAEVALPAGGNNIFKATKSVLSKNILVHSRVRLLQQTATSTFHVFKRQSVNGHCGPACLLHTVSGYRVEHVLSF